MQKMTKQNIEMWQQIQNNFFRASGISPVKKEKDNG
jgi:hypothetical protein